jgi:type III pantothenate kinase
LGTLLVDIGNTRIKWARLAGKRLVSRGAEAHAGWEAEDFQRHLLTRPQGLTAVLVASVAAPALTRSLNLAARRAGLPEPTVVTTVRRAGGITVGYLEPWRLGVDRFVAAIGAHHLFPGKALCVIGVGTAMTVDLITAQGRHLGGAIIPAPGLMVDTLLSRTNGIRRRAHGGSAGTSHGLFARSTRAGIVQGSRYAAAATIERALDEARRRLKQPPLAVLTGGGARDVRPLVRRPSRQVSDLVLQGLAVLAAGD